MPMLGAPTGGPPGGGGAWLTKGEKLWRFLRRDEVGVAGEKIDNRGVHEARAAVVHRDLRRDRRKVGGQGNLEGVAETVLQLVLVPAPGGDGEGVRLRPAIRAQGGE